MPLHKERMSNLSFRLMTFTFQLVDAFYPYISKRIESFGLKAGMTVVDYGCGPGRYTFRFAEIVGPQGMVYAADIHELAIKAIQKKADKDKITHVEAVLTEGYNTKIPSQTADVICALDMFFMIKDTMAFLTEINRICKTDGLFILDDGHQPRRKTILALEESGKWKVIEETPDHIKCKPIKDV